MKRRFLLSLIRATASFLAVAIAFGNLCPAKNTVAVEKMTVTDGGRPRRIDAPVGTLEGVSREGAFGVNETTPNGISISDEAQTFDICPMGAWRSIGWSTRVVFLILLIMSIWSIVIVVERYLTFSAARNQSREFALKIASSLRRQKIDDAIILSDKYKKNHLAVVVNAGLQRFRDDQLSSDISGVALDEPERELRRATAMKLAEFRRGLSGLATIGSTAPLVGLIGTALGVIDTFTAMGDPPLAGIWWVALDFADALLTTAAGFAVGVPAAWLLKYFTDQVDNFAIEMDGSSAELLSFFLKQRGKKDV
jgi:biopolymer transport protein ExbB/biopolymer transport protein TolQ